MNADMIAAELVRGRRRVELLEELYALETGGPVEVSGALVPMSLPPGGIMRAIAHQPVPSVVVEPREDKGKRNSEAARKRDSANTGHERRRCAGCKIEKDSRAFRGGGDTCTLCQRRNDRGEAPIAKADVTGDAEQFTPRHFEEVETRTTDTQPPRRRAAQWRQCRQCDRKLGVLKFWGAGDVCKDCDPEGTTRPQPVM